jgi:nucleoside-diphosphate-sugar epimerase
MCENSVRYQPEKTPRKQVDMSRLRALGWDRVKPLPDSIEQTYRTYLANA